VIAGGVTAAHFPQLFKNWRRSSCSGAGMEIIAGLIIFYIKSFLLNKSK
jgi:hypothetical protein